MEGSILKIRISYSLTTSNGYNHISLINSRHSNKTALHRYSCSITWSNIKFNITITLSLLRKVQPCSRGSWSSCRSYWHLIIKISKNISSKRRRTLTPSPNPIQILSRKSSITSTSFMLMKKYHFNRNIVSLQWAKIVLSSFLKPIPKA